MFTLTVGKDIMMPLNFNKYQILNYSIVFINSIDSSVHILIRFLYRPEQNF